MTRLDFIMSWLRGSGVITCSDDPLKYRTGKILSGINYAKLLKFRKANISFFCEDPYRYLLAESDVSKTSFPATYVNDGTVPSKPLLKVTGSGTVVFVVNGVSIEYVFDTAYVYIDCDKQTVFYSVPEDKNRNCTITGDDWPVLSVGSNTISVTSGTITEIVITPRTRFI